MWLVSKASVKMADHPKRKEIINYAAIIMPLNLASDLPWGKWKSGKSEE